MTTQVDALPRERVLELSRALADPTRLAIIERLRSGERCVCDLTDLLDAAQSRLSFHLRVLREAGLVDDRREGRWVYYALRPETLRALAGAMQDLGDTTAPAPAGACCG